MNVSGVKKRIRGFLTARRRYAHGVIHRIGIPRGKYRKERGFELGKNISMDELKLQINELLDSHIEEATNWVKHENFVGNSDKESWWKGARFQAAKFKASLNNEILIGQGGKGGKK